MTDDELLEIIETAAADKVVWLNLSGKGIAALPPLCRNNQAGLSSSRLNRS